jgi:hypothetical protein
MNDSGIHPEWEIKRGFPYDGGEGAEDNSGSWFLGK